MIEKIQLQVKIKFQDDENEIKIFDNWKTASEQYVGSFVLFEIVCIQQTDKKLPIGKRRMIYWTNVQLIMYTNWVVEHKLIRWTTVTEVEMEAKQRKTAGRIVLGFDHRVSHKWFRAFTKSSKHHSQDQMWIIRLYMICPF